jgi:small subunit ribosomal protein S20
VLKRNNHADFPKTAETFIKIQGGEKMANIKSAKKRIKVTEAKTLRNKIVKSALKTSIKKFEAAIAEGNAETSKTTFVAATKALDMAASKGIIHKNKAARTKSRLATKLNAMNA